LRSGLTAALTALVEKDHPWATGFWNAAGYQLHESMSRYFRDIIESPNIIVRAGHILTRIQRLK